MSNNIDNTSDKELDELYTTLNKEQLINIVKQQRNLIRLLNDKTKLLYIIKDEYERKIHDC